MFHAVISSTFVAPILNHSWSTVRLFFYLVLLLYLSEDIDKVQKRILAIICQQVWYSECLVRFDLTTLHARQVSLCHKLLNSITLRPGHRLSTSLPLKRNVRYNLGPTLRTITNHLKNYFIPNMCFFLFLLLLFFSFSSRAGIVIRIIIIIIIIIIIVI